MDGFESARLKLDRAEDLVQISGSAERLWLEALSVKATASVDPAGEGYDFVLRTPRLPPVAPGLSIVLDELMHHLRSALDHAAQQCVLDAGNEPSDGTAFPILEKPDGDTFRSRTRGMRPEVKKLMRDVQPYVQQPLKTHQNSVLWMVHRLSIIGKHRGLLPVAGDPDEAVIMAMDGFRGLSARWTRPSSGRTSPDGEILRVFGVARDFNVQTVPPDAPFLRLSFAETATTTLAPINEVAVWTRWCGKIVGGLEALRHP